MAVKSELYKFVVNVNIGELTEKKTKAISESFKSKYPAIIVQQAVPNQSVVIMNNPAERKTIVIQPNNLIFQWNIPETFSIHSLQEDLTQLFDTLLLDDSIQGALLQLTGSEDTEGSSMKKSLSFINGDHVQESSLHDLEGVGLRFLIKKGPLFWDYKFEPLLNNDKKFFVQLNCNIPPNKLDGVYGIIDEAVKYYNEKNSVLVPLLLK